MLPWYGWAMVGAVVIFVWLLIWSWLKYAKLVDEAVGRQPRRRAHRNGIGTP